MYEQLNAAGNRIEELMLRNGAGVRVVGGMVLPRFVQFNLVPCAQQVGNRTVEAARVQQVMSMQRDLALAFGAKSLRVAMAGQHIAVQVPRRKITIITADRLIELSKNKQQSEALLGIDETGKVLKLDFAAPESCHVLIAGQTGSGKTQLAHTMVYTLCKDVRISSVGVVGINPKGDILSSLIGSNLLEPVATDNDAALSLLSKMVRAMESRRAGSTPRIIVQVDEVAELTQTCPQAADLLTRLAQRGRESNIHLLLATQHPTAKSMSTLLRANLPARLVGSVASADESRIATGYPQLGAEQLNGSGDFLFVVGNNRLRFQAAMPPETEYKMPTIKMLPQPTKDDESEAEDLFRAFTTECLVMEEDAVITGKDVYRAYIDFCRANDARDEIVLNGTEFGGKLKEAYPGTHQHKRDGSKYFGITTK